MLLELLRQAGNLTIVVIGFGLIVFIHELGHFLAARWAKIRVLGFALGFGPAIFSFRKGIGLRRGSTEPEYEALLAQARDGHAEAQARLSDAVSPTEYRLNILPLGGYVKMLGQEDLDPGATSSAPDSYQNAPVWKRMVVISAGVIANLISAAALFIIVFSVGLQTEPAIIGSVAPGSPAAEAVAVNGESLPVDQRRLLAGDRAVSINGGRAESFQDLFIAAALSGANDPVDLVVSREGIDEPLRFSIVPERGDTTGMLQMGVGPAISTALLDARGAARGEFASLLASAGLEGVGPTDELISINGDPVRWATDYTAAFNASNGEPVELTFRLASGETRSFVLPGTPRLDTGLVRSETGDSIRIVDHLLGLEPLMQVGSAEPQSRGYEQGLRTGDVFLRLGEREHPTIEQGVAEIRAAAGGSLPALVLRDGREIELALAVRRDGTVGFSVSSTAGDGSWVAPASPSLETARGEPAIMPARDLVTRPGTRITRLRLGTDDTEPSAGWIETRTLLDAREAMRGLTSEAYEAGSAATLLLELALPLAREERRESRSLTLSAEAIQHLHSLGYAPPVPVSVFAPVQELLKAESPLGAVSMGLHETKRIMLSAYLTLGRLFEGTVRVEHLNGPVGIAHVGTRIADRGLIWLLFFAALVSVNLAVINFLPLPIVDGGQFLMLLWEGVRGRPVPIPVQNAVTLAGLVLIGTVFLIVTYHDIVRLVGV